MKLNINIPKNVNTIVVGVSAGPDSMALLHYLHTNTNYNIICAHINHNVRKQSIEEEQYLKEYCQHNSITFESYTIKEYKEKNFENEARIYRYNFYEKILNKYKTNYLFLAHHADDLIETILMKIVRGSNLEGYAGIKEISKKNNYYIIRPLLNYTKDEILNYNKKNNIKYYIDNTNKDNKYTRNRFKNNLLPLLKEEDKNIHKKFYKFSKTLLEYNEYIDKQVNKVIKKVYNNKEIDIKGFNKLDKIIGERIINNVLEDNYGDDLLLITDKHVENIYKLMESNKPNLSIHLPNNIIAKKNYNKFKLEKNKKYNDYDIEITDYVELPNGKKIEKIEKTTSNSNYVIKINSEDISLPLRVRNKHTGDKISIKGLNGSKKVKDIFINEKIDLDSRKIYPIVVDSNDKIIWIPGLKKSKFDKQNTEKYDIILKYY